MICKAQPRTPSFRPDFRPYQKPEAAPPWGNLTPGSLEYFQHYTELAVELANKKKITLIKAYVELVKQGWKIDMYELDEDVQKALTEAGLTGSGEKAAAVDLKSTEETLVGSTPTSPTEPPVSLDEIIKNMQENSK